MASLQHVRFIHLQAAKRSNAGLVGRLKSLVGIGNKDIDSENGKSQQDDSHVVQGEFMFDDVPRRMSMVVLKSFERTETWEQLPLTDLTSKFKLLKGCHNEFGMMPPNNIVNESKSVQDFVQFYAALRKPEVIPEVLNFQKEKMPANLTFQPNLPFKPAKRKL